MSGSEYTFRFISLNNFLYLFLWQKYLFELLTMKKPGLPPDSFFYPFFEELCFNISPLALHPRFTLKMFSKSPVLDKHDDLIPTSDRYGRELFEKLTVIETFEYHYLMTYHLENIVNKRKWIESFIMLISANKDLFISRCGIEKYTFLFEMVVDHYSVFKNAVMSPLSTSCEECCNRIITYIKHDIDFIDHFDGPERDYFCFKLNKDYIRFAMIRNFNIDPLALDNFKASNKMVDIRTQLKEGLNERSAKKDFKDLSGLKKISVNCSAVEYGKIMGDFIKNTKNKDGVYLFEYDNTRLSKLTEAGIYFKVGSQVCAKTLDDYWPSIRKTNFEVFNPG
jgi:hypothetical protein